jgi:hypothetical protein
MVLYQFPVFGQDFWLYGAGMQHPETGKQVQNIE